MDSAGDKLENITMCLYKFGNHTLVCIAVIIVEVAMLDVYAQSDIPESQLRFTDSDVCQPDSIDVPLALKEATADNQNEQPILIQADEVESEPNVWIKLSGKAQITQGKRGVYAEQITYNQQTYQATATDNVRFYSPRGDEVLADALDVVVDTGIGSAQNVRIKYADKAPYYTQRKHQKYLEDYSILAPFRNKVRQEDVQGSQESTDDDTYVRVRATADSIEFKGGAYERLYNATFSSCVQGKDDVMLFAKEIELDHKEGIGTAKSITVKFKRIPLFYLPIASFPISDKRKTGFLFPDIRYQKTSGLVLEVPYYINIAPNRDATLTPKILTNRGVQLHGEYRYLTQKAGTQKFGTQQSAGIVKAEVLPSDRVFNDNRYALSYQHQQNFNDNWNGEIDFQTLSDTHYLGDFNSGFGDTSLRYVPRRANLSYRNPDIFFKTSVSAYQVVGSDVKVADRPYNRLPELNLNLKPHDLNIFNYGFKYGIDSKLTRFKHSNKTPSGTRFRVKPYISLSINRVYGYLTPRISLQTINYSLNNNPSDNSPSVIVPIVSVDSGLFFERQFERNKTLFSQTLEPRLFYVNIPKKLEQHVFPNFDSGVGSNSSFSHFFRENRFFGGDRVGDTQQLTLGLTSRIIDHDGQQKLKLSVGQIFFLEDRQLGLTATAAPETTKQSDFLTEVTARVTEDWNIRGFTRIGQSNDLSNDLPNDSGNKLKFSRISADYYHSPRRNASIGYSRTRGVSEQMNLELKVPIGRQWQIDMKTKYSTRENKIRDFEVGVIYDDCCWATKLLVERYLDGAGNFANRFTISLELGVFGRIRTHLDD